MRFLVESRSTTDRKGIVKDDSLDRNVGSGQIVENNIISNIISDSRGRCTKKIIINDIDKVNFKEDRIIIEGNKTFDRLDGIIKKIRENDGAIEHENNIEEIEYEELVDVAIKEICDFWEYDEYDDRTRTEEVNLRSERKKDNNNNNNNNSNNNNKKKIKKVKQQGAAIAAAAAAIAANNPLKDLTQPNLNDSLKQHNVNALKLVQTDLASHVSVPQLSTLKLYVLFHKNPLNNLARNAFDKHVTPFYVTIAKGNVLQGDCFALTKHEFSSTEILMILS
ncbi:hypothetical protein HZH68_006829 [Vespula germanica]|uniref:Uncharacterized protein n=1 Tax=Vespula germanica TaxID=30212 RepID=A0A834KCI7_VESGE|nr:hypothetical protein HZH68_006829 [Vespula germanica]